jgi:hypothetical protein
MVFSKGILVTVCSYQKGGKSKHKTFNNNKIMIEEKNSNEPQNPAFLVGAVISRFSQLPRKGLLADFSKIGLEQLVEFRTNDFYDLTIFEMQLEHIKARAKELHAQFVVYHMSSNNITMSDTYLMKFTQNGL